MSRDFVTPDTPSAGINLAIKGFFFQRATPDIQSMKSPQSFTGTAGNFNHLRWPIVAGGLTLHWRDINNRPVGNHHHHVLVVDLHPTAYAVNHSLRVALIRFTHQCIPTMQLTYRSPCSTIRLNKNRAPFPGGVRHKSGGVQVNDSSNPIRALPRQCDFPGHLG